MKRLPKFTFGLLGLCILASCNNEEGFDYPNGVRLVKSPEVYAYSNGVKLNSTTANTRSSNVNGNEWYMTWDRPTNVTDAEIEKVKEAFSKPIYEENSIHIDWNNYWVQQVYKGESHYTAGNGGDVLGSDQMNHLLAYSSKEEEVVCWYPYETKLVDKTGDPYEHINNFNHGSNNTVYTDNETQEKYYGTTLMTNMYAEGIVNQFGYHNATDSQNHFEYYIMEIDGYYYIGFDFSAKAPAGQEANTNMNVERDHIYNDWIVRICPAYHVGETPADNPGGVGAQQPGGNNGGEGNNGEGEVCDNCGHSSHLGSSCADCVAGGNDCSSANGGGNNADKPEDGVKTKDQVEVNLSIEEGAAPGEVKQSHLSIHVRAATDVEVFIPVPKKFYCDVDDMAIVEKHMEEALIHGGPLTTQWEIAGQIVTLNVSFEDEGIRITTSGINEEVIKYCEETYGDGITFEVWNYFNEAITAEELRDYFNQSTVKFLDKLPDLYVNAFHQTAGGEKFDWDCTVSIDSSQSGNYADASQGWHYNGSPYNDKYYNKDLGSQEQEI